MTTGAWFSGKDLLVNDSGIGDGSDTDDGTGTGDGNGGPGPPDF